MTQDDDARYMLPDRRRNIKPTGTESNILSQVGTPFYPHCLYSRGVEVIGTSIGIPTVSAVVVGLAYPGLRVPRSGPSVRY